MYCGLPDLLEVRIQKWIQRIDTSVTNPTHTQFPHGSPYALACLSLRFA